MYSSYQLQLLHAHAPLATTARCIGYILFTETAMRLIVHVVWGNTVLEWNWNVGKGVFENAIVP